MLLCLLGQALATWALGHLGTIGELWSRAPRGVSRVVGAYHAGRVLRPSFRVWSFSKVCRVVDARPLVVWPRSLLGLRIFRWVRVSVRAWCSSLGCCGESHLGRMAGPFVSCGSGASAECRAEVVRGRRIRRSCGSGDNCAAWRLLRVAPFALPLVVVLRLAVCVAFLLSGHALWSLGLETCRTFSFGRRCFSCEAGAKLQVCRLCCAAQLRFPYVRPSILSDCGSECYCPSWFVREPPRV